jgi:hypothetical protein
VEFNSNAIGPKIQEKLQLMDKRLENVEKLMEATKQGIQSMESKLHNMLRMELDNIMSLSMQLQQ